MAIVLRETKGTALTYNEVDENFDFLERTKHNRLDPSYEGVYPNAQLTVDDKGEIVAIGSGGLLFEGVYYNPKITVDDKGVIIALEESGEYLSATSDTFAFGTNDFTIECWARAKTSADSGGIFHLSPTGFSGKNNSLAVAFAASGVAKWQLFAGNQRAATPSVTTPIPDTWYHVAVVRTAGETKLYIDGSLERTVTDVVDYTGTKLIIGGFLNLAYLLNGNIDEFRISNIARYTAPFTPQTTVFVDDENTLLLLHFNGDEGDTVFNDDNRNSTRDRVEIKVSGEPNVDTVVKKIGNGSLYVDGGAFLKAGTYENPIIKVNESGHIASITSAAGDLPPGTYQNPLITIGTSGFISNIEEGPDTIGPAILGSFEFTGNKITTSDSSPIVIQQSTVFDGGPLRVKNNMVVEGNMLVEGNNLRTGGFEFIGNRVRTNDSSEILMQQNVRVQSDLTVDGALYSDDIRTSANWFKHSELQAGRNISGGIWALWTNRGLLHQDGDFFDFDFDDRISVNILQDGLYRISASAGFRFTTTTGLNIQPVQLQIYERNTNELISRSYALAGRGDTYVSANISTIHRLDSGSRIGVRFQSSGVTYQTTSVGDFCIEFAGYSRS